MLAWHVVNSKPQQEFRAAVELTKQNFHVFLPILHQKPMFPRYLFVEFDREVDQWGSIKSTRGCMDLLRNGFLPANVPSNVMAAIMTYTPKDESSPELTFAPGQKVIVQSGPLAGLEGLFVSDRHKRVYALLEIMGKSVEVAKDSIRAA